MKASSAAAYARADRALSLAGLARFGVTSPHMSLAAGHKLAHYEIVEPIGKGGMGEVYRASDSKLGRDVAIKVLPDAFAEDEERLRRFRREAKVLASLNHPNIAAIYGLEQSGGTHYLVLELVEGETLAERIAREPIDFEEAVEIAIKISEALEEAHEHGVVHRDLKPANIKLTPDGKVKVLDFGLAKAFAEEVEDVDSSLSPTITRDQTRAGVILGTAAYMSPEQAKGKAVDKRTDIFAFGIVLYEMLTATKAFPGGDVSEVLASVIKLAPDWGALPAELPIRVGVVLRRCLVKDTKRRLRDIADARFELEDGRVEAPATPPSASKPTWLIAAALGMTVVAFAIGWLWPRGTTSSVVERFVVPLDPGLRIDTSELAFSPDGRDLVFSVLGSDSNEWQLYRRSRGELEVVPVPGSDGAVAPFFAPHGDWLGFHTAAGELKKMSWSPQGAPVSLSENASTLGGTATWSADDTIVYSSGVQLMRIAAAGGVPTPITAPDGSIHAWPQLLPNGERIVFGVSPATDSADVAVASSETGQWQTLVEDARRPSYVASGHLLYVSKQVLWAIRFDAKRGRVQGNAVPVIDGVLRYAVGQDGTLGYVQGNSLEQFRLVWVSRSGVETAALEDAEAFLRPRLSPDGKRLVVVILDAGGRGDLWVYDLDRGTRTRLTFEGSNTDPVWHPDGARITFAMGNGLRMRVVQQSIEGAGDMEMLVDQHGSYPHSWTLDGRVLAFYGRSGDTAAILGPRNISTLSVDDSERRLFLGTSFNERSPSFSRDGRFIAYTSNESGEDQIYIQAFPGPGVKIAVSRGGGHEPVWSRDGEELFFRRGDEVWVAAVSYGSRLEVSEPTLLFDGPYASGAGSSSGSQTYDVAPDGRFLMVKRENDSSSRLIVVLNWVEELKRLVPVE